jgi:hypothetical protein
VNDILLDDVQEVGITDAQEGLFNKLLAVEVFETVLTIEPSPAVPKSQFINMMRHVEHSFS